MEVPKAPTSKREVVLQGLFTSLEVGGAPTHDTNARGGGKAGTMMPEPQALVLGVL